MNLHFAEIFTCSIFFFECSDFFVFLLAQMNVPFFLKYSSVRLFLNTVTFFSVFTFLCNLVAFNLKMFVIIFFWMKWRFLFSFFFYNFVEFGCFCFGNICRRICVFWKYSSNRFCLICFFFKFVEFGLV